MPTRPSGSSKRKAPITSTSPGASGPHDCVGIQSAISSDLVGVMVAAWNLAMTRHRTVQPGRSTAELVRLRRSPGAGGLTVEEAREVGHEVLRVVAGAVDEARLPTAQERRTDQV